MVKSAALSGLCILLLCCCTVLPAQPLSMKDALQTALDNYPVLRAKNNYRKAAEAQQVQSRREYLPNFSLSAQQDYGTINGQNGPLFGYNGLAVASSGLPLATQNWNAAFGALYLANVNWEFFAFGRARERIRVAGKVADRDAEDYNQERFQQQVRVAATYLNLLAARRLYQSGAKNLERAQTLRLVVVARAANGIIPGVDSSQANAEVSAARIALNRAGDAVQEQESQLAQLMGVPVQHFEPDTFFISSVPAAALGGGAAAVGPGHPLLRYYRERIGLADRQTRYYRTLQYPSFSLFGILQTRASGFTSAYTTDQTNYSRDYFTGVNPSRSNYLLGIGLTWNLTSILRVRQQVQAQRYIADAARDEYELSRQRLDAQMTLADGRMERALLNYREAPQQVQAASDAYRQRSVQYQNGLSNIVDVTQALYQLNRAETDRDIAYNNVWQALLLRAAASGDLGIFINEF